MVAYAYACKQLAFPAVDTVNLKTATVEKIRPELRNRFEGLGFVADASPEDEWRLLKNAVAESCQTHSGRTRLRRRNWVIGETIARLTSYQCPPNYRDVRGQIAIQYEGIAILSARPLWKGQ